MRWLQLCDFHLGREDEDQAIAMKELISAIGLAAEDIPIDAVIISGDLAFSGLEQEYKNLKSDVILPLRSLEITKNAKFISVPGNHDLDCTSTLPLNWASLGKSRQDLFWNSDQKGIDIRSHRAPAFAAYAKFLHECDILGPDPQKQVGMVVSIDSHMPVTLICLNTALFSDKDLCEDDEVGQSPLPVHTLRQLMHQSKSAGQVIVIGHHPTRWFEAQSRQHFLSALLKFGAMYLHGHEHKIEADFSVNQLKTLGFGATYPGRLGGKLQQPYTSSFAICQLDDRLHIKFISWESENGVWRPFHSLQPEFSERSAILSDGYVVPVPSTKSSTVEISQLRRRKEIVVRPKISPPIWIEGSPVRTWATLLRRLGLIAAGYTISEDEIQNVAGHSKFFVRDSLGRHLFHAAAGETSFITYDHVESANTQLDALRLTSCTILTLGSVMQAASNLANTLRGTKPLRLLTGTEISEMLIDTSDFSRTTELFTTVKENVLFTPVVLGDDFGVLVIDAVRNKWFSIVGSDGRILTESEEIFRKVCEKLPHLKSMEARLPDGVTSQRSIGSLKEFDESTYLARCMTLFDTAKYTGLAAIGARLPIESLRRIYVPTSANVDQRQAALEATERAIDDLVETLGLDELQRDQLSRQMRSQYGLQQSSEVSAAGHLYHNFSNVVVLGDPGSGKTCFVRAQIMSYCERNGTELGGWYGKHVPVFLPLVEYTYSPENPEALLKKCISHAYSQGLKISLEQLEILISRGRVAFFFDGLDEIGSIVARQKALEEISELVDTYAVLGNRFVLTSRPAAVRDVHLPNELTSLSLLGLTNQEIELLAHRLFEARYPAGEHISSNDQNVIDSILKDCSEKPGIRRLARNPLLLTLLVFIYENSGAFAARRHLIYSQAVKTLVSVRLREIKRAMLSEADLRIRLGKFAVAVFGRELSALPTRAEALRLLQNLITEKNEQDDGDFIQNVAEATGLLIVHPRTHDRTEDLVSFMHHSFLEYYTALGFLEDEKRLKVVFDIALNPRWREVVTLIFGILGEQSDISDRIKELCRSRSGSDDITVHRLKLAFDCAWECDVPPEETQELLASQLTTVMSVGSGLFVSEVREELADKLSTSLITSESRQLRRALVKGIASEDENVAAAFVHLAAKMNKYSNGDDEIVREILGAFERGGRVVRIAVVNAMREMTTLRSAESFERIGRILDRGGNLEKSAVLQMLDQEVALVPRFSKQLQTLLYGNVRYLAVVAAGCILRGGIFEQNGYTDLVLFEKALETYGASDAPKQSLRGRLRVSWEQVEAWIFDDDVGTRQRGFRSLVLIESDVVKIRDTLFEALKRESHHDVLSTILMSLASYELAIRTASLAETDLVCKFTKSEFRNVRRGAARALRAFPAIRMVSDALISQYQRLEGKFDAEMREVIKSLTAHASKNDVCKTLLEDELVAKLSKSNHNWSHNYKGLLSDLISACDQVIVSLDHHQANKLFVLGSDFRTPRDVRRVAMRFFGQCCAKSPENMDKITLEFSASREDRRLAAYRASRRLVQRCRGRVETVRIMADSFIKLRDELIKSWSREMSLAREKFDVPTLREIRNLLVEIEETLVAHNEFAERMSADAYASLEGKCDLIEN